MNNAHFLNDLQQHSPCDVTESKHLQEMLNLVAGDPECWWRRTRENGHVTASAWILDQQCHHVLLLHHAKLNRWLQPGGHLEEHDANPAAGALREAREETGMVELQLISEKIFDVDVHPIPERGTEPAHLHYDVRYCLTSASGHVRLNDESQGFRWVRLEEIVTQHEESLARMARKSLETSW